MTNKVKCLNKTITHFEMKPKSKRDKTCTIRFQGYKINPDSIDVKDGTRGCFNFKVDKSQLKRLQRLKDVDSSRKDIAISKEKNGSLKLLVFEERAQETIASDGVIALDPGTRNFMTSYDSNGDSEIFDKWKRSSMEKNCQEIDRLGGCIDKIKSKRSKVTRKLRKRITRYHNKCMEGR